MQKIKIIAMGHLTFPPFRDAAAEYLKRLEKRFSVTVVEPKPQQLSHNPGENEIKIALEKEKSAIMAEIQPRSAVIAMCVEGKEMSSEDFSAMLEGYAVSGVSEVVFVIGSSYGLSEEIKKSADKRVSVSKMTFPHELFRVMLLEQLYRAGEISAGTKYHK
jgi:23S rRNA (pseudouridine1915-N3)-methyltransferase